MSLCIYVMLQQHGGKVISGSSRRMRELNAQEIGIDLDLVFDLEMSGYVGQHKHGLTLNIVVGVIIHIWVLNVENHLVDLEMMDDTDT